MITKPFVGVLLLLCAGAAAAATGVPACVTVQQGWARLPPNPAMPMTAGYGVIRNGCAKAVAISGARSASFGDVSLHETTIVDGVSRMRAVERLAQLGLVDQPLGQRAGGLRADRRVGPFAQPFGECHLAYMVFIRSKP